MNRLLKQLKTAIPILALLAAGCRTPMPPGAASHGLRLGPFFETASADDGSRLLAIRPFYSGETIASPLAATCATNAADEADADGKAALLNSREEKDILWPLGIYSRRDDHYYWRALLFYGTGTIDDPSSPNDPWRFRLFPFIFAGRSQDGSEYGAFFPFYGTIHDFLVFHDTSFVLFPIYAEGRSPSGTEMRTVLWPFYLTRHGERVDQFRLWPFYGTMENRSSHITRRSRFVAWPFWTDASSTGQVEGSGFMLFPIYSHSRYERRRRGVEESWGVIPPLFQYARGDDGYRKLFAPWPFIRAIDKDEISERHFWPLYGVTRKFARPGGPSPEAKDRRGNDDAPFLTREYFLWPLISFTDVKHDGSSERVTHLPLPFYFHREREVLHPAGDGGGQTGTVARAGARTSYSRLWPLFSYRHAEAAGASETTVRFPELSLWSKSEQVERNWAPLWSLYTYRSKPDGAYCNDVLWGLLSWGRNASGGTIFSLFWINFTKGNK